MADLRTVIEALANLQDDEWILDICGTGVRLNEIRALAEPLGSRVQFHGAVPEGQLASFYQDASVGIVPLQPGGSRASVPSKTYSYWAAALPVLCIVDPNSHFDKLLKQHTVGWSAPAGDTEALTQTIRQALRASDETLDEMGARARQLYEQRYSPEAGSRRFLETLLRILNEGDSESPTGRAPRS
jgi:glycosyltransferase involved in cell wall biosynthesis